MYNRYNNHATVCTYQHNMQAKYDCRNSIRKLCAFTNRNLGVLPHLEIFRNSSGLKIVIKMGMVQ